MYVCVSVENRLEREIGYSADFFQSQVPRTKRYPVYCLHHFEQYCARPPLTQMTRLASFRSPTLVLSLERLSLSLSVETILIVS